MAKKKKPKKRKPDPSTILSQEQKEQLSNLLKNFKDLNHANVNEQIPGPELAQAFIEGLPTQDPDAVPALLAVRKAFPQKKVQSTSTTVWDWSGVGPR